MSSCAIAPGAFLADVAWHIRDARVVRMSAGTSLMTHEFRATFVMVRSGTIRLGERECPSTHLAAGDVLLRTDCTATLLASSDAVLAVADIEPRTTAARLPATLVVRDVATASPELARLIDTVESSGDDAARRHMATELLEGAVRACSTRGCAPLDWLMHARDLCIERALDAMHHDPAAQWTVATLATEARMSRSAFAARFLAELGTPPLSYLTALRIAAAQHQLVRGSSVARVAAAVGYGSEAGFSRAFTRALGETPSRWKSRMRTAPSPLLG